MKILLIALVIAYLLITFYFFTNWLKFFRRTPKLSPEDMFLSLVILVVSTILWPFVVLMSSLELLKARNLQLSSVMTVVLAMFVVSLLTISGLAAFGPALPQAFSALSSELCQSRLTTMSFQGFDPLISSQNVHNEHLPTETDRTAFSDLFPGNHL